jgi:hypothetical protein
VRVLEQASREGVALVRSLLDGSRKQAHHGVEQHECRQLASGKDVITDAHLAVDQGANAFVDALVAAADKGEMWLESQLTRQRIGQPLAGGVEQDHLRAGVAKRLDGSEKRLRAHDHPRSPAVRVVVDRPMTAKAVVAQVVNAELDNPSLRRPTDDRGAQRELEELREERNDVDTHRLSEPLRHRRRRSP